MEFTTDHDPDNSGYRALTALIEQFNDGSTGLPDPARRLALLVRDEAGTVTGGLRATSYYAWMFIDLLILPEARRGQGLGTRLMQAAEAEASRLGLLGIWLDTFSFQARPFYERLGYRLVGSIADFPPGGARHWLAKRLDGRPLSADNPAQA